MRDLRIHVRDHVDLRGRLLLRRLRNAAQGLEDLWVLFLLKSRPKRDETVWPRQDRPKNTTACQNTEQRELEMEAPSIHPFGRGDEEQETCDGAG
jgi:hypothetical protein